MGRAIFTAREPHQTTRADLETLISDLRAVTQWDVDLTGTMTIEYDEQAGSVEVIEEALAGLGFEVQPIADQPTAGNSTGVTATTRGAHDENVSMRHAQAREPRLNSSGINPIKVASTKV